MRRRIVVCLGILLALCLLGDAIAMLCLHRSTRQLSRLVESRRIQSMRETLTSDGVRLETDLLSLLAGRRHTPEQARNHIRRFERSLGRCAGCHHVPAVQAELDGIGAVFAAYRATTGALFEGPVDEDVDALKAGAMDLVNRIVLETTAISDRARSHLASRSTDVAASIHNARVVLWATFVAALVCGGFVAFHLKRRLTKPVEALLEGIARVGRGDLTHRFSIEADEEFRLLGSAFNQAYAQLKKAQDAMLQAEKMAAVGKLAAGVAHEVGNPLASISSIAQVMRRSCESDGQREQIELILSEVGRISRIVRDLLTFSRPNSGEKQVPVEIHALLERAATLLGYDSRARHIGINRPENADLGTVRGDPDRLLLVCTNVMINAFDAIDEQSKAGGTLSIHCERNGDSVVMRFEDNGPGMTEAQIANAFEPFFSTKEPGKGTGLGLWICYQVVRRHHGTIRIDSRLGQGTTVTIELPCDPGDSDQPESVTAGKDGPNVRQAF
ncbi:MAG: HAMP domain-containing sensor histidine kinase [Phycisphaerae bacterium]